jgi:Leucine-rich repeat (LRR) protein
LLASSAELDPLEVNCTGSISLGSYDALESLYNSAGGENWKWDPLSPSSTIWHFPSSTAAPCSDGWQGLTCLQILNGSMCDIGTISLEGRGLKGTIPPALGQLENTTNLYLGFNYLEGTIPSELGYLSNLEGLHLSVNSLSGTVPSELGRLINLYVLGLNTNELVGTIPSELGNLVNIALLYLYSTSLEGTIPAELGNLRNVEVLYLFDNLLDGTLPTELGNLAKVAVLDLDANLLVGTIPTELGNLVNMEVLYLYANSLSGTIPTELGQLVELEALSLNNNQLDGTIPSELGNLVNMVGLELKSNVLGGSIPSEVGGLTEMTSLDVSDNYFVASVPLTVNHWSSLQYLNLSYNEFTGPVEILASVNFSVLQVIDLSNNRFTGTLTTSLFLLPKLQTVVASQNCFSGSLPWSLCLNDKLENVVLDLLTANCGSNGGPLEGYVLRQYMLGTIPACIWNTTSLRVLHLLGNGFTGTVADISDASSLSVVGIGSNQLTGIIPRTFQLHKFAQLDLSINRLSGTLESDLLVSPLTTVYDLSVNRLSGKIPNALYGSFKSGVMNILEGNLFECQQHNIPSSDKGHGSYQCGSTNFEDSLLVWFTGIVVIVVTMTMIALLGADWTNQIFMVIRSHLLPSVLVGPLYCLAVSMFGLVGFAIVKLRHLHVGASTHADQYWWTTTVVFVHSWTISLFLCSLLAVSCAVFVVTMMSLVRKTDLDKKSGTLVPPVVTVFRCLGAHLVNIVVVTAVNAVYILVAFDSLNNVALLSVQAALGAFKLAWSTWVIPWLLTIAVANSSNQIPHWTFMVLFIFLGAPFTSSFSESSACFLYLLTKPSLSSFSFVISSISTGTVCDRADCQVLSTTVPAVIQNTILPPWMYSYQCSSAIITSYAPVLILSYLMSGVVVPFTTLALAHCPPHISASVGKALPFMMFKMTYTDNSSAAVMLNNIGDSRFGKRMAVKFILNLAVMLTFGMAVPLLDLAVVCDTAFHICMVTVLSDRFIGDCNCNGLDTRGARQKFWNSFRLRTRDVTRCCYIVLGYISVFWSLFIFDWIGDVYGSLSGGLVMLVPLLFPMLIGFFMLRRRILREHMEVTWQKSDDIELNEISNPVLLPQSGAEKF